MITKLNTIIRKSGERHLPRDEYRNCPKITRVREFEVEFGRNLLKEFNAPIPSGASELIEIVASLPIALRAQQEPNEQLARTLEASRGLKFE